ncbi:HNH endonuclease [Halorubellus sp. PRR65]|uniref:HNH endonuclease n=1 Tax=Halorubellus sp. PRR65 TaxID=3098148 RepID=UPI002B25FB3E|nr:HNH endonuclease [Halorubellus sp. PRR65]
MPPDYPPNKTLNVGDVVEVLAIRITNNGDVWCPVPTEVLRDSIRIDTDEFEDPQSIINTAVTAKIVKIGTHSTRAIPVSDSDVKHSFVSRYKNTIKSGEDIQSDGNLPGQLEKAEADIPTTKTNPDSTSTNPYSEQGDVGEQKSEEVGSGQGKGSPNRDLSELRKIAKKDETLEVSTENKTSQRASQEYSRSVAIKRYVKERAEGECEGCREQAPFISKTGEPYLHAHHVFELSKGGKDTIDSVIALCPNCHYRVHHGVDGDAYNQELIEKLREIE